MTETTMVRFDALAADVERAFDAIRERNAGCMECREGAVIAVVVVCRSRDSKRRFSVAGSRDYENRFDNLAARATAEDREMCPALDANGACQIYESRPLICRSHGVPLRYRYPVPLVQPTRIDVCEKNFTDVAADALPDEDVVDQTKLTAELTALDAEFCDEHGLARDERVPLAQILAEDV